MEGYFLDAYFTWGYFGDVWWFLWYSLDAYHRLLLDFDSRFSRLHTADFLRWLSSDLCSNTITVTPPRPTEWHTRYRAGRAAASPRTPSLDEEADVDRVSAIQHTISLHLNISPTSLISFADTLKLSTFDAIALGVHCCLKQPAWLLRHWHASTIKLLSWHAQFDYRHCRYQSTWPDATNEFISQAHFDFPATQAAFSLRLPESLPLLSAYSRPKASLTWFPLSKTVPPLPTLPTSCDFKQMIPLR
jgi:hypothetical protein